MTDKNIILPFYAKASIFLVGLSVLLAILYIGQDIIVPFVFAVIIAILINPMVNFFVRRKINKLVAIIISLLLVIIVLAGSGVFLFWQISLFSESWPVFVNQISAMINQTIDSVSAYIDIKPQYIYDWIAKTRAEFLATNSAVIGQTIVSLGSGVISLLLVPVYIFLILYYKSLLLEFIRRLFAAHYQTQVGEIITETKTVVQSYLIALIIETVIVAVLNSAGLLIIGIDYAILLGIIGALLNLIPYIGGIVAVALPMMIALATKSTAWYAFYVLVLYVVVQLVDNYYIVPKIVASKVKINALFAIIVVLLGNALWGISGMFLSIPLLAIVKLVFDRIEPLKPWGFLLGDTMPHLLKLKPVFKKTKNNSP